MHSQVCRQPPISTTVSAFTHGRIWEFSSRLTRTGISGYPVVSFRASEVTEYSEAWFSASKKIGYLLPLAPGTGKKERTGSFPTVSCSSRTRLLACPAKDCGRAGRTLQQNHWKLMSNDPGKGKCHLCKRSEKTQCVLPLQLRIVQD